MTLAIRTERLTKIYGNRLVAVNDLRLEVPQGSIYGLLGPNGAGKTTTLRLLLGLHRPTAGVAEVLGRRCGANRVTARRLIGYLPTNPKLPGHLTPIEYLDLLGQLYRIPHDQRKARLASLLRAVGLLNASGQRIRTFSTGMNTRLGIAASLIGDPPLLIWDEPTAGLDPAARRFTLELIRDLGRSRTIVVATHILGDIDQVCSHVGVMHEGRMIFTGSMREMKQRLKRDSCRLELDGDPAAMERLAAQVDRLEGVEAEAAGGLVLQLRFAEGCNRAARLVEVLQMVDAAQLTLQAVHSGRNETEDVYMQLLQEDQAHGFQRIDFADHKSPDAVPGDSSA